MSTPRVGYRNGRAAKIRAVLATDHRAWSASEIAKALGNNTTATQVLTSLHDMVRRGHVLRVGRGHGVKWRMGEVPVPAPGAHAKRSTDHLAPAKPTGQRGPLPVNQDLARDALSRDLAAFEARGGRVQVLGVTKVFADPIPAANQPIPGPRASNGRRRTAGTLL